MIVDMPITAGTDIKIDQAMTSNLIEHMIEKGNPGFKIGLAAAIQVNANLYLGFQRISADCGNAI